jgi:hypothetical protein
MKKFKDKVAGVTRRRRAERRSDSPAQRPIRDPRPLLDRILETPQLARVVPRLPPEVLHRVIQNCGLEDCGELVALATPGQLAAVFDLDLWRPAQPGLDEQFDADRFGLWLQVMMESDATVAAQKLAGMDVNLAIVGFAQHVLVFDPAAVSPSASMDGDMPAVGAPNDGISCNVGGYLVVARRSDAWDAIVAVLTSLDAEHHDYFHRVMRGCRNLSNSRQEIDGLDDLLPIEEQVMFDLAFDREGRREKQGFITPAQARAFLQMARQLQLAQETTPPRNPVADAYFRAIEWTAPVNTDASRLRAASSSSAAPTDCADPIAAIVDALTEGGVLPQPPRALLGGPDGDAQRLSRIQAQMQFAHDRDHAAYSTRTEEFAYLANTIVAGCSIQARPLTVREASDAAAAVCNLGLENWPTQWLAEKAGAMSSALDAGTTLPEDFLVNHDLISVFQVGWTVLHSDVGMYAAEHLIQVLTGLRNDDRQIQAGLDALRIEMERHWRDGAPWRAREALDVIVLLDMPAWATLLGLIDECPVIPAAIGASRGSRTRAVSASAFEFISESGQIASVHEFMGSLANTLRC